MNIGFEITVPKEWWDEDKVLAAMESTLKKETGKKIKKDFSTTVRGWRAKNTAGQKVKPTFNTKFSKNRQMLSINIFTRDDIYRFINDGTAPRMIFPAAKASLRFKPGYTASSSPGKIKSGKSRRTGAFMNATYVRHPGIEAREFDETIAKKQLGPFMLDINRVLYKGLTD